MTQAFNLSQLANNVDSSGKLSLTAGVTGVLPVANGGNGTSTPALVAGANITVSGSWPNQTIAASGSAPTTAQVLSAMAGASAGAVGTFAFLASDIAFSTVVAGTNYAGSGLYYAALVVQASDSNGWATGAFPAAASGGNRGSSPGGTWKALGSYTNSGTYLSKATLFLRVA